MIKQFLSTCRFSIAKQYASSFGSSISPTTNQVIPKMLNECLKLTTIFHKYSKKDFISKNTFKDASRTGYKVIKECLQEQALRVL